MNNSHHSPILTPEQIKEMYGESATIFDSIKIDFPEIDSLNRSIFKLDIKTFELTLNTAMEVKYKLFLLQSEKMKLATIVNSWFFDYNIVIGGFELTKINTPDRFRDEIANAFPEIIEIIDNIPTAVRLNKDIRENAEHFYNVQEAFYNFEINTHSSTHLYKTILESGKIDSEVEKGMIEDFIEVLESGDENYQYTNLLSRFYYTKKYYDFICEKHDTLKAEMNGDINTGGGKLYWQGNKVELIKIAYALSDLKKIRCDLDPNPDGIVVVNEILKAFNQKPVKNPQSNLHEHFNSGKAIDKVLEIFVKMKKRIQSRFNERRTLND